MYAGKKKKLRPKAKKNWYSCECAVTMREMLQQVNARRAVNRFGPVSIAMFRKLRCLAADDHHAKFPDGNLDKNPFIPNTMIGNNYIFSAARAERLMRLAEWLAVLNPCGEGGRDSARPCRQRGTIASYARAGEL